MFVVKLFMMVDYLHDHNVDFQNYKIWLYHNLDCILDEGYCRNALCPLS